MLKEKIKASFERNKKRYGSPRICRELGQEGVLCGRHRVARLMRQNSRQPPILNTAILSRLIFWIGTSRLVSPTEFGQEI